MWVSGEQRQALDSRDLPLADPKSSAPRGTEYRVLAAGCPPLPAQPCCSKRSLGKDGEGWVAPLPSPTPTPCPPLFSQGL